MQFHPEANLPRVLKLLSDGVYADVVTAAMREGIANAIDACRIAAGKPGEVRAVRIQFPEKGVVEIADDGDGIPDLRVLFAIGGSTKESSDTDLIGRFGIGALSLLAIAESILVRSCGKQLVWNVKQPDVFEIVDDLLDLRGCRVTIAVDPQKPETSRLLDRSAWVKFINEQMSYVETPIIVDGTELNLIPPWNIAPATEHHELTAFTCDRTDVQARLAINKQRRKTELNVYQLGVLLTADGKRMLELPPWLDELAGGVVSSTLLQPTAGRDGFKTNDGSRRVGAILKTAILAHLSHLIDFEPHTFEAILLEYREPLVKAVLDDAAARAVLLDHLPLRASTGWTPVGEVVKQVHKSAGQLIYTTAVQAVGDDFEIADAKSRTLVHCRNHLDEQLLLLVADQHRLSLRKLSTELLREPSLVEAASAETLNRLFAAAARKADLRMTVRSFEPKSLLLAVRADEGELGAGDSESHHLVRSYFQSASPILLLNCASEQEISELSSLPTAWQQLIAELLVLQAKSAAELANSREIESLRSVSRRLIRKLLRRKRRDRGDQE